jgi:hypothetical protein
MQLEIFTLCDAATEHAGKLNIIGTFDALRGLEAPIAHPQCAIAGRLRFEQIEEGNHRVSLTFADEDGNIVMPKFDSTLAVHFAPGLRTVTSHFVMVSLVRFRCTFRRSNRSLHKLSVVSRGRIHDLVPRLRALRVQVCKADFARDRG